MVAAALAKYPQERLMGEVSKRPHWRHASRIVKPPQMSEIIAPLAVYSDRGNPLIRKDFTPKGAYWLNLVEASVVWTKDPAIIIKRAVHRGR